MKDKLVMGNKIDTPLILFLLFISMLFACDKENINKEYGQYAVAVTYNGDSFLKLHFVIDGKECGSFVPAPDINPSYVEDCSGLKNPDNLTNIFVLKEVPVGEHTLEIRTAEGNLVKILEFQMINKECVFQELNIEFN